MERQNINLHAIDCDQLHRLRLLYVQCRCTASDILTRKDTSNEEIFDNGRAPANGTCWLRQHWKCDRRGTRELRAHGAEYGAWRHA